MGMLVEGLWSEEDRTIQNGAYVRPEAPFSAPIPSRVVHGTAKEPGRYHLIASLSCPWSHRVTLVRAVKGLSNVLRMHVAGGPRTQGYRMGCPAQPWNVPGTDHWIEHLHQLYTMVDPTLTARVTVPVLWDSVERTVISNESAQLLSALDAVPGKDVSRMDWTLAPKHLCTEIQTLSTKIQTGLCNAVYRAGKARRQDVYETAVDEVFATLHDLETRLSKARFLHGSALTETDLRLWPTLARFDQVYHGHFKCARRRLVDYPNLWGYARDVHTWPGVAETFDPDAIRHAYYHEDRDINPSGVVATAPDLDWTLAHDRNQFGDRHVWTRNGRCLPAEMKRWTDHSAVAEL